MKHVLILFFCLNFSNSVQANSKAEEAAEFFAKRDFNAEGVQMAERAVSLYGEAIALETDAQKSRQLVLDKATAHYFLGTALEEKEARKAHHQSAMDLSDQVLKLMGLNPDNMHELSDAQVKEILHKFNEEEEYLVADAMYSKGINLSQWGRLNGIASSVGKLPVVLGLMDGIEKLGYESIHEYGPYRTIGRINYILPSILGGDLKKSEEYLKDAYRMSLVPGQKYSSNGYNNIYLAETLYKLGKETQGRKLIDVFLAADFSTLKEGSEPENREALRLAQELHDQWN